MAKLTWGTCDCCGGSLPLVDGDNDGDGLPRQLAHGGDCPGHMTDEYICGGYDGWSRHRIEKYAARHGVKIAEDATPRTTDLTLREVWQQYHRAQIVKLDGMRCQTDGQKQRDTLQDVIIAHQRAIENLKE